MNSFLMIFLQDPVMISAGAVLAGTIGILVWAVKSLNEASPEQQDTTYEDIQPNAPERQTDDNAGLAEARLQAIVNQLNDISQRLIEIEKAVKTTKITDQTIPMLLTPQKLTT
jgi:5-bromo-4-chloroindolyl phosphate hydrolysis protein